MKVSSITQYNIHKSIISTKKNDNSCRVNNNWFPQYNPEFKANVPIIKPFVESLDTLFLRDIEYKKSLLSNVGLDRTEYIKIKSILGGKEIKDIIKKLGNNAENFSAGNNFENIHAGKILANLHIHTNNSDGTFSVQELLDKAAEYGDFLATKKQPPFVIAITDHDTTEGIEQATKIIVENPKKYKNIRVIMGAEITTFDNVATNMINFPTNTHLLVYGINPQEERFKDFIDGTKQQKFNVAEKMTVVANDTFSKINSQKDFYSTAEAKLFSTQFREGVTGMYNHIDKYVKTKFLLYKIIREYPEIKNTLAKNQGDAFKQLIEYYKPINNNNYKQTPHELVETFLINNANLDAQEAFNIIKDELSDMTTKFFYKFLDDGFQQYKITLNPKYRYVPTYKMVYDALCNQPDALIGIAHPLDNASKLKDEQKMLFMDKLYKKFKENCKEKALFCETYYQSYSKDTKIFNETSDTKIYMKKLAEKHNLISTGGIDNHRTNLFERY